MQESSEADDLERWKHCLVSACTTVVACAALLLLALPAARTDAFLLSLTSSPPSSGTGSGSVWDVLQAGSVARYVCMVAWALLPYLLGERVLRPLCAALTDYEQHVNKVHMLCLCVFLRGCSVPVKNCSD